MPGTQPADVAIRSMHLDDWPAVSAIWAEGIATGNATFEVMPPTLAEFDALRHPFARIVAVSKPRAAAWDGTAPPPRSGRAEDERPDRILGWAAAAATSSRRIYAGVAESTVYVSDAARGRGIGRALLEALIRLTEATGIWTLQAGIFPENAASLALHRRCGFNVLGKHEWIGRRGGHWRDVLFLERRSLRVGDDGPLVRLALPGRPARGIADVDAVRGLLQAAQLPPDGLDDVWRLWVTDADGTGGDVVGAVALERYEAGDWMSGAEADAEAAYLLRSLVVDPRRQGEGLAGELVAATLTVADLDAGGTARIGLLTMSAHDYFPRLGFRPVERAELPEALANAPQVVSICPASAQALLRD